MKILHWTFTTITPRYFSVTFRKTKVLNVFCNKVLTINPILQVDKMQIYTDNREWKVLGSPSAEKFAVKYPCCPEKYEYIDFKFELQRDSPAYRSVIILPCLGNSDFF